MKRTGFPASVALGVLLAAACGAHAQPTRGDILIAGLGGQPTVHRFERVGSMITYHPALMTSALMGRIPGNSNPRPYVRDLIVDHDNQTAIGVVYDTPVRWLVRFDPRTGAVLGTLMQFPTNTKQLYEPYDVNRDQDGGYVVVGRDDHLWKLDATFQRVSSLDLNQAYPGFPVPYDYVLNYDDGHALLYYIYTIYRVDRITGAVTSLFANPNFRSHGVSYQMTQDFRTGKILWCTSGGGAATNCTAVWELDVTTPQSMPVIRVGAPNCPVPNYATAFCARFDRQSPRNPLLLYGGAYFWGGLGAIDLSPPVPTVTLLYPFLGSVVPYSMDIVGSVDLTSRLLKPDRWQIDVSFPNHPSKPYVLAISLSGTRFGFPVDTRTVNLTPDSITVAGVSGRLWPIFAGNNGILDRSGRAAAVLDLSFVKGALQGQPIYFVALVLDPKAPNSIAMISDPYMILPGANY